MKKIYVFLIIFTAGVFLNGCSLKEEPQGLISPTVFYKSEGDFNAAMAGAYKSLFGGYAAFDFNHAELLLGGAEDVTSRYVAPNLTKEDYFVEDGNSDQVKNIWAACYKAINCSNLIVSNVASSAIEQSKKDKFEGQGRFLRAWCYYFLTRCWGKVPLVTSENVSNATNVGESEVADIYAYIVADLQKAETLLTDSHTDKMNPSQGGAQLLLADVYLTMAGSPVNDASNYAKARDEVKKIIDQGSYSLEPKFADLWKTRNATTSPEIIFEFHGTNTGTWIEGSHLQTASRPTEEGGWCDMFTDSLYFNAFPAGPRKDATFHSWFYFHTNNVLDSIYWKNSVASFNQPYMAKFRDAGSSTASDYAIQQVINNDGAGFFTVQRFAEAYLIYAEAANMAEGSPSTTAYSYINKIRERAGLADLASGLTKDQFNTAVMSEREWEFAFELRRWFDLVRTQAILQTNLQTMAPIIYAEHGPGTQHPVHDYNILLPKPTAEVQIIKGLNQNTGY